MKFKPKEYSHLVGLKGFSKQLLTNHFTLYEGYVENTNKLHEVLLSVDKESAEFAELKRRFGWEFNGMRLHEYYFDNLGEHAPLKKSPLQEAIERDFGSLVQWENDFRATGACRGIGWAVLCRDHWTGSLFNIWIDEHDVGNLAGCSPLLVLDVFEHAYMLDYGLERKDYIAAFMESIRWEIAVERFDNAREYVPTEV